MKKKLSLFLLFVLFSMTGLSQNIKIVEENIGTASAELNLIVIDKDGKENIINSFTKPLMLYFHYSFYLDADNKAVYFLSSSNTEIGVNGKMGFRYDLEKFDVQTEKVLFTTSCHVSESVENNNIYFLTKEGYLRKDFNHTTSELPLVNLKPTDSWCE
jgi:hypothetical protein